MKTQRVRGNEEQTEQEEFKLNKGGHRKMTEKSVAFLKVCWNAQGQRGTSTFFIYFFVRQNVHLRHFHQIHGIP